MRVPRVYTSVPLCEHQSLELDERAAHYLTQVLRMKAGRELVLFNGDGYEYPAVATDVGRRHLRCDTAARVDCSAREPSLHIELGIGISKGDRMDTVVQKTTELGVGRIVPLYTERVDVKLHGDREDKKHRHWQQVMISACEQSGRSRLVNMAEPMQLDDWLVAEPAALNLVLCPDRGNIEQWRAASKPAHIRLLVGPEGGLTDAEIERATERQFCPLQLGPRVLRTETAPIAAISIMQFLYGDMG